MGRRTSHGRHLDKGSFAAAPQTQIAATHAPRIPAKTRYLQTSMEQLSEVAFIGSERSWLNQTHWFERIVHVGHCLNGFNQRLGESLRERLEDITTQVDCSRTKQINNLLRCRSQGVHGQHLLQLMPNPNASFLYTPETWLL